MTGKSYINRNGLLVPADISDAASLRGHLSAERDFAAVTNEDEWLRLAQGAEHDMRLADIAELAARAKRARRARQRDADEAEKLAELYRAAKSSGARAKVRAAINGSAEVRALRLEKMRRAVLWIGMPVLAAFGAWSTAGVHDGFVRMLHLDDGDPLWWAGWGIEPALLAIVAALIVGRSMLRTVGGRDDWKAYVGEFGALAVSIFLNMYGGWDASGWRGFGHAVTHSFGPLGSAGTAFLIGLYVSYINNTDPWQGASKIDDLDFAGALEPRHSDDEGPRQLPKTHLPELPSDAPTDAPGNARADRRDATPDAPSRLRRGPQRSGPVARRAQTASPAPTSGDAPGGDRATQGAHLVLTRGLSYRKAASEVGGTSEASVRRRVKELRGDNPADASDDADADPTSERAERVITNPLPPSFTEPNAPVTSGVNGNHPTFTEEH